VSLLTVYATTLGDIGNVAEGVAAFAAVVGLYFAGYQVRQGRQLERERLASSYLARLNGRNFYDAMSESRETLNVPLWRRDSCWNAFSAMRLRDQQRYFVVMNLFEELATLYNDAQVSERAVRRLLADTSIAYWGEVRWFVDRYRRETGDAKAFSEWEKMNARLRTPPTPWPVDGLFIGV
jgi:hypothetical protein